MLVNAIWDFDGTLYDSYPMMMPGLMTVLAHTSVRDRPEVDVYTAVKKTSIRYFLTTLAHKDELDATQLQAAYAAESAKHLDQIQAYPHAAGVLAAVIASGGANFLLTHRDDAAWDILRRDHLDHLFSGGVTASMHLPRKPAPDAIDHLVARHQLNPAVTAMIGDRALDVRAGQNAGVQTIYFDVDHLHDAPDATYTVAALTEIPPLFG